MTRTALAALIQTLVTARDDIERQARLVGAAQTVAAPVKSLDYTLALLETDLLERDAAEDELVAALPRTRLALTEAAVFCPELADAAGGDRYLDAGRYGSVYPSAEA